MRALAPEHREALRQRLKLLVEAEGRRRAEQPPKADPRTGRVLRIRGRGNSWATFAHHLRLSSKTLNDWLNENHTAAPSLQQLRAIAQETTASLDWLLFGEGGDGPVYRGQLRTTGELAVDLAAHVARHLDQAAQRGDLPPRPKPEGPFLRLLRRKLGVPAAPQEITGWQINGDQLLADLVDRETAAMRDQLLAERLELEQGDLVIDLENISKAYEEGRELPREQIALAFRKAAAIAAADRRRFAAWLERERRRHRPLSALAVATPGGADP